MSLTSSFDEIHYINDIERGTVWEESLIFAPQHIKFVCLSATIPNINPFTEWMQSVRDIDIEIVEELKRPVRWSITSILKITVSVVWRISLRFAIYRNATRVNENPIRLMIRSLKHFPLILQRQGLFRIFVEKSSYLACISVLAAKVVKRMRSHWYTDRSYSCLIKNKKHRF